MRAPHSKTLAAVLLASSASFAQGAPTDAARKHFEDGKRLFREGKQANNPAKLDQACGEFLTAYGLRATKNVLWNVIVCEGATKKSLEAMRHLRDYVKTNGTPPEGTDAAKELAEQWDPAYAATGHLRIDAPAGAEVSVAGASLQAPLVDEVDVPPGVQAVLAKLGDRNARSEVTAVGGKTVNVKLTFATPATTPDAALPISPETGGNRELLPPDEASPAKEDPRRTARAFAVIALGAGAVTSFALALGFKAGVSSAEGKASGFRAELGTSACTTPSANADCANLRAANSDARRDATASTVSLVSAISLTALAAGAFLLWPRGSARRSMWIAPMWGGAASGFSF